MTLSAKYRVPRNDAFARAGRTAAKIPMPRTTPISALTNASIEAMTLICRGVAPTRRMAANRSSRRAAASRVAVPIRMSIGNRTASAPTMNATLKYGENTCCGSPVAIRSTVIVFGNAASWAGWYPMKTASSSGPDRAWGPIVPVRMPGKRAPSSSRGTVRSSAASAGEA